MKGTIPGPTISPIYTKVDVYEHDASSMTTQRWDDGHKDGTSKVSISTAVPRSSPAPLAGSAGPTHRLRALADTARASVSSKSRACRACGDTEGGDGG